MLDMMVFLEVVDTRTFTAAADRLNRTKSAISQSITRLETDLDCRLLHRSTRSMSLTEAGARFYAHCRDLRQTYDGALADLRDVADPSGTLSVTAPHALCASVMVPVIACYMAEQPRMRVRLLAEDSQVNLIDAQIDLAVRVGPPKEQTAQISRLGTLGEGLYASPDHVAQMGGPPVELSTLADWHHIANDWQGDPVTYTTSDGATLRVSPRARCNALPDILRLAETGAGVALLPDVAANDSVAAGALIRLFAMNATPVFSMHHFQTRPPGKVKHFIKLLRAELGRRPVLKSGKAVETASC